MALEVTINGQKERKENSKSWKRERERGLRIGFRKSRVYRCMLCMNCVCDNWEDKKDEDVEKHKILKNIAKWREFKKSRWCLW